MRQVHWAKTDAGCWYPFETFNLFHVKGSGVYVIWYDAAKPASVCVGHGLIASRIADRRSDRGVLMYRDLGLLYVTWAELPHGIQQGAARYLTEKLQPPFGDTLFLVPPIEIDPPDFARKLERV
jgi:hypothetical protein